MTFWLKENIQSTSVIEEYILDSYNIFGFLMEKKILLIKKLGLIINFNKFDRYNL